MSAQDAITPEKEKPLVGLLVVALAAFVALVSARTYVAAWNDSSRLATVECLVDHHTLTIDDSVFVKVPDGSAAFADPRLDRRESLRADPGISRER